MISIRKRGKVYQYCFEAGKVNGKRKQITKSGFKTKNEAFIAGQKAYDKFINGESTTECNMLYSDYLDYWMKEYIETILNRFKNNKVFICAFITACYTGMRTGEVFALTWDDIDLDNRVIKINKTVYAKDKENKGR